MLELQRHDALASTDGEGRSEQARALDRAIAVVEIRQHVVHDLGEQAARLVDCRRVIDVAVALRRIAR